MPRKTKIGNEVEHVTRDSDTTFKVKRSNVSLQMAGVYCGGLPHSLFLQLYYVRFNAWVYALHEHAKRVQHSKSPTFYRIYRVLFWLFILFSCVGPWQGRSHNFSLQSGDLKSFYAPLSMSLFHGAPNPVALAHLRRGYTTVMSQCNNANLSRL